MNVSLPTQSSSFKKSILNWARPYIDLPLAGIDISDQSMKYFLFDTRGDFSIDTFGEINIPSGLIERGEIRDEHGLTEVLRSWFVKEKKHFRSPFVAASLPEEKSFLRVVQLPRMEQEKVKNALRWELEANIPLTPEELAYDFEIIESDLSSNHFDIVVVAFSRTVVESYTRVLKGAGLQPATLELESQAITRSIVPNSGVHSTTIIIDMGHTRTSFIIFSGGAIIFTTTMELGGKTLENAIGKALDVPPDEAVKIKKTVGIQRSARESKVFAALTPQLNELVTKLHTVVEYYQGYTEHRHAASKTIDTILLSGGDANLLGLDTYIANALKIPVVLSDPFVTVKNTLNPSIPPLARNRSLAFAAAIGLALGTIRTTYPST
jgi:type IV pilus assembly protein PilM